MIPNSSDACNTFTEQAIRSFGNQFVAVDVAEFKNWYLADSEALSKMLGCEVNINNPEQQKNAGFTVEKAARHPNCPSARYFLTTLQTLASANKF